MTCSGMSEGDSLLQVDRSALSWVLGGSSSGASLVSFLISLVQVSVGTAHEHSDSMLRLLMPLMSLKVPFSPQ